MGIKMSYKIAIASSDEKMIDESFGSAKRFLIYEITEDGYHKAEERIVNEGTGKQQSEISQLQNDSSKQGCSPNADCGTGSGCGTGAQSGCGSGTGCGASHAVSEKVLLVSDCRCIGCKKIGFNVQKQLERKAITSFDVDCSIEEALQKISFYFSKIDKHQSLRGFRN